MICSSRTGISDPLTWRGGTCHGLCFESWDSNGGRRDHSSERGAAAIVCSSQEGQGYKVASSFSAGPPLLFVAVARSVVLGTPSAAVPAVAAAVPAPPVAVEEPHVALAVVTPAVAEAA